MHVLSFKNIKVIEKLLPSKITTLLEKNFMSFFIFINFFSIMFFFFYFTIIFSRKDRSNYSKSQ